MVYSYNVILHKPNYIQQNGWHSQRQYWMNEARLKYILHNFNFRNFKSKLNRNQDSCYIGEGRGTENDWEHKQMWLLEFWCFLIWVLFIQVGLLCENQSSIHLIYTLYVYQGLDEKEKGKPTGFQISEEAEIIIIIW